ncbi:MAG: hypothetical protein ABJL54_16030 [Halioglobus sp.]
MEVMVFVIMICGIVCVGLLAVIARLLNLEGDRHYRLQAMNWAANCSALEKGEKFDSYRRLLKDMKREYKWDEFMPTNPYDLPEPSGPEVSLWKKASSDSKL